MCCDCWFGRQTEHHQNDIEHLWTMYQFVKSFFRSFQFTVIVLGSKKQQLRIFHVTLQKVGNPPKSLHLVEKSSELCQLAQLHLTGDSASRSRRTTSWWMELGMDPKTTIDPRALCLLVFTERDLGMKSSICWRFDESWRTLQLDPLRDW